MPGLSWSIPAKKSCPRANGTICENCYAAKGRYIFANVQNAQHARFAWTVESMRTPEGRSAWVATMVDAIRGQQYFRIHDSGDVFNPAYAEAWYQVALQLPETKFWLPTRAYQQPSGVLPVFDPILSTLRKLAALPNVTVRPSALNFGDNAPVVPGLHAGSTADHFEGIHECPSAQQGGHCGNCRFCWDSPELPVSYHKH